MLSKKELQNTNEYWIEEIQNELYRQVISYMKRFNLNKNELAEKWGVSKGYISQILNGNCNFSLKKLVKLSLAMEKFPIIQFSDANASVEVTTSKKIKTGKENSTLDTFKFT